LTKEKRKQLIGGFDGCRGDGVRLSFVVLVSEKPNLVSKKSGKSQGILFICGAGNPARGPLPKLFKLCPWGQN